MSECCRCGSESFLFSCLDGLTRCRACVSFMSPLTGVHLKGLSPRRASKNVLTARRVAKYGNRQK